MRRYDESVSTSIKKTWQGGKNRNNGDLMSTKDYSVCIFAVRIKRTRSSLPLVTTIVDATLELVWDWSFITEWARSGISNGLEVSPQFTLSSEAIRRLFWRFNLGSLWNQHRDNKKMYKGIQNHHSRSILIRISFEIIRSRELSILKYAPNEPVQINSRRACNSFSGQYNLNFTK